MPPRSSEEYRRSKPEVLPLIDGEKLRRLQESSTSSRRRSQDSSRDTAPESSGRRRSDFVRVNHSKDQQHSSRVRKVTYKDSDGNMTREVRFNSKGEAEMNYGSSKEATPSSASNSDSIRSSGEEKKWVEYKHRGTSRERVIRMTYTFPDGSSKTLDYE